MYWDIKKIEIIDKENYTLKVFFADGLNGLVKFEPSFFRGVFAHLINPDEFDKATIFDNVVTWPGHLDLAPDAMWEGIKDNNGIHILK